MFTSRYHDVTCCDKTDLLSHYGDLFLLKSFVVASISLFFKHDMLVFHSKDLLVFQDTFTALLQFLLHFKIRHTILRPIHKKEVTSLSPKLTWLRSDWLFFVPRIWPHTHRTNLSISETEIDLFMMSIY